MALIPVGYLTAVVSLGIVSSGEYGHRGTGFLYRHPIAQTTEQTTYLSMLVTSAHVAAAARSSPTHVRFDSPSDGSLTVGSIADLTHGDWFRHPNADVAVRVVYPKSPLMSGRDAADTEVFVGDTGTTFAEGVRLAEGDGVFIIGFPLDLIGKQQNYPIVRFGVVSRIQDWLRGDKTTFLIDAPAFPGNSGGPVIVKPEAIALTGTKAISRALLAGVIKSNIRSRDVAVSQQTGEPRIVFEENTGLTEVVPIELVRETAVLAAAAIGH